MEEVWTLDTDDTTYAITRESQMRDFWDRVVDHADAEENGADNPVRLRAKRKRRQGELEKPVIVRERVEVAAAEEVLPDADRPRRSR